MTEFNSFSYSDLGDLIENQMDTSSDVSVSRFKAEVSNIDSNNVLWTRILGASKDTPVEPPSFTVKQGDIVEIEFSNGKAYIVSNITDPAASSEKTEQKFEQVENSVRSVGNVVENVQEMTNEVQKMASATNQHFWTRSTDPDGDGAGTGAFVTDEEQDVFLDEAAHDFPDYEPDEDDPDYRPFHNLLMNSLGLLLRRARNILASFTGKAVTFYDGAWNGSSATEDAHTIATFGQKVMLRAKRADGDTYTFKVDGDGIDFRNEGWGSQTSQWVQTSIDPAGFDFLTSITVSPDGAVSGLEFDTHYAQFESMDFLFRHDWQNEENVIGYYRNYNFEPLTLFKVITFQDTTPSISNTSGSSGWLNIRNVPAGYTAIGIVGVDSNHGYAWTTRTHKIDIENQKIAYTYTNTSSTNQNCTFTFYLLCVPSGNVG